MDSTEVLLPPCLIQPLPNISSATTAPYQIEMKVPASCPWGKAPLPLSVSLNDVMSEQLATTLLEEEEQQFSAKPDSSICIEDLATLENETDCSDDHLLAKMLQLEFDKEHDKMLKQEESQYNRSSKVIVSFGKYLRLPDVSNSSDEEDYSEALLEQSARSQWHNIEQAEKAFQSMGKSGVSRQGTTTTKHDIGISERRNAGKLLELSPGFSTGDSSAFDMRISNNVFNTLRTHSVAEAKRSHKRHDKKEISTAEKALDERTHLILYKLVNDQTLESVSGCISTGKEACVYHAWSGMPAEEFPSPEFALKVFKTTLNEFQNRDEYIRDDHRFRHRLGKQNPRKTIHMWAEKEMRNLLRMKEADLPCPQVVVLRKHVLVMSFIGNKMLPAPKLKEVDLPFEDMTIAYDQTLEIMKTLYRRCRLVHADLSEFNLLWHDERVWVIDVSQAVENTHPGALNFLLRDCTNISTFFEKRGIKVLSPEDLFTAVCDKKVTEVMSEGTLQQGQNVDSDAGADG